MAREPRGGAARGPVKRKERKNISSGVAHVLSTFNNTIVTLTDTNGKACLLKTYDAAVEKEGGG